MALISKRRFTDTSEDVQPENFENPENGTEQNQENVHVEQVDNQTYQNATVEKPKRKRVVHAKVAKVKVSSEQPVKENNQNQESHEEQSLDNSENKNYNQENLSYESPVTSTENQNDNSESEQQSAAAEQTPAVDQTTDASQSEQRPNENGQRYDGRRNWNNSRNNRYQNNRRYNNNRLNNYEGKSSYQNQQRANDAEVLQKQEVPEDYESKPRLEINNLTKMGMPELRNLAIQYGMSSDDLAPMKKQELIFVILKAHTEHGGIIFASGALEILPDGYGFLRSPQNSYLPGPDDIYISPWLS